MSLTFFIFDDTNADENAQSFEIVDYTTSLDFDEIALSELVDDDALGQEWMKLQAGITLPDQLALDALFEQDFTWQEALSLLTLRNKAHALVEVTEHPAMQFARWLYTHGHLTEDLPSDR